MLRPLTFLQLPKKMMTDPRPIISDRSLKTCKMSLRLSMNRGLIGREELNPMSEVNFDYLITDPGKAGKRSP
jgi:hypothetical protein